MEYGIYEPETDLIGQIQNNRVLEEAAAKAAIKSEAYKSMHRNQTTISIPTLPPPQPMMFPSSPSERSKESDATKNIDYNVTLENEGWYYDAQLNNEMQSISLHANQKYIPGPSTYDELNAVNQARKNDNVDVYSDWGPWTDEPCDDDVYESNYEGATGCGYRIEPICRSLFYEDFVVNAANSWSDLGGDVVGGVWDAMRTSAPFSEFLSKAFGEMEDKLDSRHYDNKLSDLFSNGLHSLSNSYSLMSLYQNKSLVVTGTQMALFGGTGLDFSNLGLRLTLFPEIKYDSSGVHYKTVTEQVEELYPYLIGIYKPDVTLGNAIEGIVKGMKPDSEFKAYDISPYIGWNNPPGGYRANNKLLDSIHQGTLKLRIGGQYSIPNLVCQSATFAFSKQMVKLPKTRINPASELLNDIELETSPLYCDLSIILRPMSRYTNRVLNEYIASKKSDGSRSVRKQQLDEKINSNLQSLKKKEQGRK